MFSGFRNVNLFLSKFENFNGIRIVMKPPQHPVKLGMYLRTGMKEYEHFVVFIYHSLYCRVIY